MRDFKKKKNKKTYFDLFLLLDLSFDLDLDLPRDFLVSSLVALSRVWNISNWKAVSKGVRRMSHFRNQTSALKRSYRIGIYCMVVALMTWTEEQ